MKTLSALCFAGLVLILGFIGQERQGSPAFKTLVEAERSFAATSVERGARPSFMMFFADDAVVFRPHPVNYKEAMKNVPLPKNPTEATLNWEPIYADVAASGELGYTTGPSEWIDHSAAKRPPYYGFYFSFWKKQPSGEWKVVFDVGTELPGQYGGSRTLLSPAAVERRGEGRSLNSEESHSSLMKVDGDFLTAAKKMDVPNAFDRFVDESARFYRQKQNPIVGKNAFQKYFLSKPYLSTWSAIRSEVAKSGELGYVYGSYSVKGAGGKPADEEKGYYLRAWKRDARDNWKLVAEVLSQLPPDAPKSKQ